MLKQWKCAVLACLVLSALLAPAAFADGYPSKGVTLVVPWGAGGVTDVAARYSPPCSRSTWAFPW